MASTGGGGSPLRSVCGSFTGMNPGEQKKIVEVVFGGALPILYADDTNTTGRQATVAREVYELPGSAKAQCRAVINHILEDPRVSPVEKAEYKNCWICGLKLNEGTAVLGGSICEHVLPIIQAVMYIGLYYSPYYKSLPNTVAAASSSASATAVGGAGEDNEPAYTPSPQTKETYLKSLRNEYRYAHNLCNAKKGEKLFISNNSKGLFEVNEGLITKLLEDIFLEYPKGFGRDSATFVRNRLAAIKHVLEPIIDRMNGKFEDPVTGITHAPNLSQLAAAAALVSFPWAAKEKMGKQTILGAGPPDVNPPRIVCQIVGNIRGIYDRILKDEVNRKKEAITTGELNFLSAIAYTVPTLAPAINPILEELEACCSSTAAVCTSDIYAYLVTELDRVKGEITSQFDLVSVVQSLTDYTVHLVFEKALPRASVITSGTSSRSRRKNITPDQARLLEDFQLHLRELFIREKVGLLLKTADETAVCSTGTAATTSARAMNESVLGPSSTSAVAAVGGGGSNASADAINFSSYHPGYRTIVLFGFKNGKSTGITSSREPIGLGIPGTLGQAATALALLRRPTMAGKVPGGGMAAIRERREAADYYSRTGRGKTQEKREEYNSNNNLGGGYRKTQKRSKRSRRTIKKRRT